MENPRRIYYYEDDEGLEYMQFPYTYEDYHAFEGYNVGAERGWHPSRWEGYNEGAYRGGWNDDLQAGARHHHRQRLHYEKGRLSSEPWRPEHTSGPYAGRGPRNFVRADARILDDVNYRLTLNGQVNASHVHAMVENGVVILTGSIPDRRQKRMAEDLAESVPGVKDVENRLTLSGGRDRDTNRG